MTFSKRRAKMKKVTKSFVAILALVAMLTQNAFGVYAQATAPEPIQVENEYVSENAEPTVEVTTEETPVDTPSEPLDPFFTDKVVDVPSPKVKVMTFVPPSAVDVVVCLAETEIFLYKSFILCQSTIKPVSVNIFIVYNF